MPYRFACPKDRCSFELRCDAGEEVVRLARAHARMAHHGRFAPADLDRWVERVEAA